MRDKESPPKRGVKLEVEDDDDSDDAPRGGRNKGKPDGNKKEKARVKRMAEAITLRDQIGEIEKMKETMLAKHWDAKVVMAEKKEKHKEEKWGKRCAFEERKLVLEEQKRKDERTANEDWFMMMNPEGMDVDGKGVLGD